MASSYTATAMADQRSHPERSHPARPPQRREQGIPGKLGLNFATPQKRRPPTKFSKAVVMVGHDKRYRDASNRLDDLLNRKHRQKHAANPPADPAQSSPSVLLERSPPIDTNIVNTSNAHPDDEWEDMNDPPDPTPFSTDGQPPSKSIRLERGVPDDAAKLLERWTSLIPTLVNPFVRYCNGAANHPVKRVEARDLVSECTDGQCISKAAEVLALYWDSFETITVHACSCQSLPQVLVRRGLFPASPREPRVAFSTDLLDLYRALFEKASDAVQSFASALKIFHNRRGYTMLDSKAGVSIPYRMIALIARVPQGHPFRDPFRRGLASSLRWFDALRGLISRRVEDALRSANTTIRSRLKTVECDWDLQRRCPACFGGSKFGRPFAQGGDIHVCLDGNFHHRHRRSAGDTPSSYIPRVFINNLQVLAAETHLRNLRERTSPCEDIPPALDAAIEECRKVYVAADGRKAKANGEVFDDTGLMALVCRHDVPLFFANIDSPGEQQKYAVALLYHLFSLLPSNATVCALYDVGCVLAKSSNNYDYFPEAMKARLQFATSAMHAYGHQWVCQLAYNPRMIEGMGLTDGEGVERLWSRLRKLIGITRTSARSNRIRLLDGQATALQTELCDDLGQWIRRRLGHLEKAETEAQQHLDGIGIDVQTLRDQWGDQRKTQISLRQHAPSRLKREIDTVLGLQADLDAIANSIDNTCKTIFAGYTSPIIVDHLNGLERIYNDLQVQTRDLYTSLNVTDDMPLIKGVTLDMYRQLILARDLKIVIRKRAVASFFEWERLDQASAGREAALGTKLHQETRAKIAKRAPAIVNLIRKYNGYIEALEPQYSADWHIPLPPKLPLTLAELRDDSNLMEDFWLLPSAATPPPPWLADRRTRAGIRTLLKRTRCREERQRVGREADAMCRWFGKQLAAVELALRTPGNTLIATQLSSHRAQLLRLPHSWQTTLVSPQRFASQVKYAMELTEDIVNGPHPAEYVWIHPKTVHDTTVICIGAADGQLTVDAEQPLYDPEDEVHDPEDLIFEDLAHDEPDAYAATMEDDNLCESSIDLLWYIPAHVQTDFKLRELLTSYPSPPSFLPHNLNAGNVHVPISEKPSVFFYRSDIDLLLTPRVELNDVCVNGCGVLLQCLVAQTNSVGSRDVAIFSTHDYAMHQTTVDDAALWRSVQRRKYWLRDEWFIPIHMSATRHWVACTVHRSSRRIHIFDSLADQDLWKKEIQGVWDFVKRLHSMPLVTSEMKTELSGWRTFPITITPLQSNNTDCGYWVLAFLAAYLRGFHMPAIHEDDMKTLRSFLLGLVLAFPNT